MMRSYDHGLYVTGELNVIWRGFAFLKFVLLLGYIVVHILSAISPQLS